MAVIVIMSAALFSTPGTYFSTNTAIIAGPFTLGSKGGNTGLACINTLYTAAGTIIFTLLTSHLDEAILTVGPASGTGFQAIEIGLR